MPRAKKKAVKSKSVSKPVAQKSEATPALKNAHAALEKLQKELTLQTSQLAAARNKTKKARATAAKNGTASDNSAAKKAAAAETRLSGRITSTRARVSATKDRVKKLNDGAALKATIEKVKTSLTQQKEDIANKTAADAKVAIAAFEAQWRKKRAKADAAKLKLAEKRAAAKVQAAEQKAATNARVAVKKAAASAKRKGQPVTKQKAVASTAKAKAGKAVAKKKAPARKAAATPA